MEARDLFRQPYICNCGGPGNPWPHLVARSTRYHQRDASSALAQTSDPAGLRDQDSSEDDGEGLDDGSAFTGDDMDDASEREIEEEDVYRDGQPEPEFQAGEDFDIAEDDRGSLGLENESVNGGYQEGTQDGFEFANGHEGDQDIHLQVGMDQMEFEPQSLLQEVNIEPGHGVQLPPDARSRPYGHTNRLYNPRPRTLPHWPIDEEHLDRRRFNPGRPIGVGDPARIWNNIVHQSLQPILGHLFAGINVVAAGAGPPNGGDSDSSSSSDSEPDFHTYRDPSRDRTQTPSDRKSVV